MQVTLLVSRTLRHEVVPLIFLFYFLDSRSRTLDGLYSRIHNVTEQGRHNRKTSHDDVLVRQSGSILIMPQDLIRSEPVAVVVGVALNLE